MKNMKMLCVVLFILALITGCGQKKEVLKRTEKRDSWEKPFTLKKIPSEEEGNFCFISQGHGMPIIIPNLYFVQRTAYTGTTYEIENRYYEIKDTERYEIGIYDFHTLEKIKTIDMVKVMAPYMQDWQIYGVGSWVGEYNHKYYFTQSVVKKQTEDEIMEDKKNEYSYLWIDIEDETASWIDKEPDRVYVPSNEDDNIWMLMGSKILRSNGYENIYVENLYTLEDTSYIRIPTNKLPKKNEKLYSLFPDLKDVSREEDLYAHIYLHPRTNAIEALSLILDEGKRLDFDALKPESDGTYGFYLKNDERHYITKEEYEQFQRDYEEYFNREEH